NGAWVKLSHPNNGTPGFASYNYCGGQCTYDMPVYSPPGAPHIVYIGGSMQYSELGRRSNGRAVQRSMDAGVSFTDMTIDTHGVRTLQCQSLSVNVNDPSNDIMGGTQDNGTQAFNSGSWFVTIFGDGGQSGIDFLNPNNRFHTFFDAQIDVNFNGTAETGWDWVSDTFFSGAGGSEPRSFYIPIIHDPTVSGTIFTGLQHVWRRQDNARS